MSKTHAVSRVILFLAILGAWQWSSHIGWLNPLLLPSPLQIGTGVVHLIASGDLFTHALASLGRIAAGYTISVLIAIPLGLFLGWNSITRYYLNPVLALLRPIPPIAWIPLSVLWFGIGNGPSYFITMVSSFFPILINTMTGVERVEPRHIEVARSLGSSPNLILKDVILPSSLPYILTGMRLGLVVAWMSVVAAEIVSAHTGLGYFIEINQELVHSDMVLIGMLSIGAIGIVLDLSLQRLQKALIRW